MRLGQLLTDRSDHFGRVARVIAELGDHGQSLLAGHLHLEGGTEAGPDRRVTSLDGPLDVLGVVVHSPDDQEILEASGDDELAPVNGPEVAGPEESARSRVDEAGAEGAFGLLRAPPISARDAWALDPDLTDLARTAWRSLLRMDDLDPRSADRRATADQHSSPPVGTTDLHHPVISQRCGVDGQEDRFVRHVVERGEQGGLGQPERRAHGRRPKAVRRERLDERARRFRMDRFRSVPRCTPRAEIELGSLGRRRPADAQAVHEARALAVRDPVPRHDLEPPDRMLHERGGRQDVTRDADDERLEQTFDQPVIVVVRHPHG